MPSTTKLWNNLPINVKQANTIQHFKNNINNLNPITKPNAFFTIGSRQSNILHCRLRDGASSLNYDLFRAHFVNDPSCSCGHPCEDEAHFLLWCPNYTNSRLILLRSMNWYHTVTLDILLFGDNDLSLNQNIVIAQSVQKYIVAT